MQALIVLSYAWWARGVVTQSVSRCDSNSLGMWLCESQFSQWALIDWIMIRYMENPKNSILLIVHQFYRILPFSISFFSDKIIGLKGGIWFGEIWLLCLPALPFSWSLSIVWKIYTLWTVNSHFKDMKNSTGIRQVSLDQFHLQHCNFAFVLAVYVSAVSVCCLACHRSV